MTAEEIRTAAELYESGKSLKEIEAVIFYTPQAISINLRKIGVKMRKCGVKKGGKISAYKGKTDKIVDLYKAGYSTHRIAAAMSCTSTTIIRVLKSEGVEMRKSSGRFADNEIAKFVELYNSGLSCAQIAEIYFCTPITISKYLTALGIKLNSNRPHKPVPKELVIQ